MYYMDCEGLRKKRPARLINDYLPGGRRIAAGRMTKKLNNTIIIRYVKNRKP